MGYRGRIFYMTVNVLKNFIDGEHIHKIISGSDRFLEKIDIRNGYFEDVHPKKAMSLNDPNIEVDKRASSKEEIDSSIYISNAMYLTKNKLETFYKKTLNRYEGGLVKLTAGAHNGLHSDMYQLDGSAWNDGTGRENEMPYSALLYLSNYGKHFKGGEIIFPQHDLCIYPESGDLVFFVGDLDHVHEVKKIISGERYAIIMFFGE